ncbi:Tkp3 protein [Vanderwaltozyma polyspora DSM 70294]|uniref:Tkp3 protein n=1 Tax=Vanderwaltozyma polyspora (strain ATCC 22028 / DSM 70294 / BCRC 21397 / CBS 2163 / NBRC 10782 / NRRL Y-8283 / UCD 57-17) TaxID=436907 RepID=A7TEQ9_VANPO|nr:Tkp3 protein [Vanderwaltozyma polyspora DSM 70294]EDO19155.1 Tkp3 protein [Vanderwaltozyma polyspora DSM 70294]
MNQQKLWNPNAPLLLLDTIRNCKNCETYQSFKDLPVELPNFKPIPVLTTWHLDFAGLFPIDDEFRYFIIAVDYTSNFTDTTPLISPNSDAVCKMILRKYRMFGKPRTNITNNVASATSHTIADEINHLKIKYIQSSVYSPVATARLNVL